MTDRCEDCGVRWYEDANLLYDEDGHLICSDCFFEKESMRGLEEDDAENYV